MSWDDDSPNLKEQDPVSLHNLFDELDQLNEEYRGLEKSKSEINLRQTDLINAINGCQKQIDKEYSRLKMLQIDRSDWGRTRGQGIVK